MKLINPYPTPAFAFQQYNNRAELLAVITAKATYEIVDGNSLRFMEEQPDIALKDQYTGPEAPPHIWFSKLILYPISLERT